MLINSSSSQRGQSLLEYAVILALIIGGIIVGGPILMKAVNSHFRLLDDTTQDSLTEQLKPSTSPGGPIVDGVCSCTDWVMTTGPAGCGNSVGCNSKSRKHTRTCTSNCDASGGNCMTNCDTEEKCVSDPTCCSELIDMVCGTLLPDGSTTALDECPGRTTTDLIKIQNELSPSGTYKGTCTDQEDKDTQKCAIGERKVRMECGTNPNATTETQTVFYACKTEDTCLPNCYPYLLSVKDNALDCQSNTDKNTIPRQDLIAEVIKRKTPPDSNLKPTRSVKIFTANETEFDISAVQLPYAFIQSESACTEAPNTGRSCQAYCKQDPSDPLKIYLPSSDGTTCTPAFCAPTTRSSFARNSIRARFHI